MKVKDLQSILDTLPDKADVELDVSGVSSIDIFIVVGGVGGIERVVLASSLTLEVLA